MKAIMTSSCCTTRFAEIAVVPPRLSLCEPDAWTASGAWSEISGLFAHRSSFRDVLKRETGR
jgi:hypothetical protein